MAFCDPPPTATWSHGGSRSGFEAVTFHRRKHGWLAGGLTTAVENGCEWWVMYEIELDASFVTRRATITAATGAGAPSAILLEADGAGSWVVDGRPAPALDGCLDIDLESSAMTNALPMRSPNESTDGDLPKPGGVAGVDCVRGDAADARR